jgi:hypothetical protein
MEHATTTESRGSRTLGSYSAYRKEKGGDHETTPASARKIPKATSREGKSRRKDTLQRSKEQDNAKTEEDATSSG